MPELRVIRRIWVNEKHEFDDALPRIYDKVFHKEFVDPAWIHNDNFGRTEWETLKKVCQDMYPDEELAFEMMYTLVDVENKAAGINARRGILAKINAAIAQNCYKNEADATQFYSDTMVRKKQSGGKYNENFLDYQPASADFRDEDE